MPVELSIVVVHHNAPDFLRRCLRSIPPGAGGLSYETVVVDNASQGSDALVKEFPDVRWVQNSENLGFGKAMNQGVEASSAPLLILLNQDVELLPGALKAVHRFFEEKRSEKIGFVGGKLMFSDGSLQPSCGSFPHLVNLICRYPLPPEKRRCYLHVPARDPLPVDWVTGAFMAVRRSVFESVDGFDTDFFLYYEDVDLCLRACRAGFPSYYLPEAAAYHHQPHAIRKAADAGLQRIIQTSRSLYFKKHRPAWESWVLRIIRGPHTY